MAKSVAELITNYRSAFKEFVKRYDSLSVSDREMLRKYLENCIATLGYWEQVRQQEKEIKEIIDFVLEYTRKYTRAEVLFPPKTREEFEQILRGNLKKITWTTVQRETTGFVPGKPLILTGAFFAKMMFLEELNEIVRSRQRWLLGRKQTFIRFVNPKEADIMKETKYKYLFQLFERGQPIPTLDGSKLADVEGKSRRELREIYLDLGCSGNLGEVFVFRTRFRSLPPFKTRGLGWPQANFPHFSPIELVKIL